MTAVTWVLRRALIIDEIWRLYVVFVFNWRVVVLPVGSRSPRSSIYGIY